MERISQPFKCETLLIFDLAELTSWKMITFENE